MNGSRREFLRTAAMLPFALQHPAVFANPVKRSLTRIATEEAFLTPEIAEGWKSLLANGALDEPGFRRMGTMLFQDNPGSRLIRDRLLDVGERRLQHMDATGIAVQVMSMASPGVQVFETSTAIELAKQSNDRLGEAIAAHPKRFAGLATIAPQSPIDAATELERAVQELGLKGAIINSHTKGEYLDDEKFWPIFEAAQSLNVPIYLHPRTPSPTMIEPYLDYGLYLAGWGFAVETSLHAMRLIGGGVFDQFPNLKVILGHMGEGIPFWLQRLDDQHLLRMKMGGVKKEQKLPSQYFENNFLITTSGVTSHAVLRLVQEVLGAKRILFAADYPYASVEEAVQFMDTAPISDSDRQKIYHNNAEMLFKLS